MTTTDTTDPTPTFSVGAQAPRSAHDRSAGRRSGTRILVTAILVVVAVYFLVPVYWVVVAAT